MAKKISDLTAIVTPATTDLFETSQGGVSKKITLAQLALAVLPSGTILMWKGTIATIPTGFALCNGSNGTPNLLNKFIVAANADSGGVAKTTIVGAAVQTGGSTTIAFSGNVADPTVVGNLVVDVGISNDDPGGTWSSSIEASLQDPAITGSASNVAPPFFALAYIMKL